MPNLNIFRKPAPAPARRPDISGPLPGSGTHFVGNQVPSRPSPAAAPAPQPAQGSTLAHPVGGARQGRDQVDIRTVGWPANNHYTDKYNDLRDKRKEAKANLENARATGSRQDVKLAKEAKAQAKREVDVFKQRHGGAMRTEADYRETYSASRPTVQDSNTLPHMPERPRSPQPQPPASPAQPARTPSPAETFTSIGTDEMRMHDSSVAARSAQEQRLEDARDAYRDSKNLYDGMRPEQDIHTPQNVRAAKSRAKEAERRLDRETKAAQAEARLRQTGFQGPSQDELRQLLRPGTGNDRFPALDVRGHRPAQANAPETLLP